MKNNILKQNCLLIALAIIMQMIGTPKIVNAGWGPSPIKENKSNTGLILAGIGVACAVTVIIIVLSKKKKKNNAHSYNFQNLPVNYSMTKIFLPIESKTELDKELQKQNTLIPVKTSPFFKPSLFMTYVNIYKKDTGNKNIDFLKAPFDYNKGLFTQN